MAIASADAARDACARDAIHAPSGSAIVHAIAAATYARRKAPTHEWYTLRDVPRVARPSTAPRRRPDFVCASDDRARVDAHLLGHHVLPLRVSGDLDRPL